ncbi:hypothetical protein [Mycoplasma sp. OR1901]|uniref:hypothetical protein n=1 Tax=Mycoplasma sp. OR1901 TaxID=2742195 RepID=UPI001581D8F8|nr:hypothetical protein [Mycoplasma sp. OR1901]QKT05293.1 hypothetical protein HTZ87_01070 [Mycoplasma sp. OR1901]
MDQKTKKEDTNETILMILSNKENKELNKEIKWFKKNIDKDFKPIFDYEKDFFNSLEKLNFKKFEYSDDLKTLIDKSFKLKLDLSENYSNFMYQYDFNENLKINSDIMKIIDKITKK